MKHLVPLCLIVFLVSCIEETKRETIHRPITQYDNLTQVGTTALNGIEAKEIVSDTICDLPPVAEKFLSLKEQGKLYDYFPRKEKSFEYDEVYYYLYFSADSIDTKKVLKEDEFWGPVVWEQHFDCGITYRNRQYVEVGAGGELYSRSKNKSQFLKVIEPVIHYQPCEDCYDPNQVWKEDSTRYEPAEEGAGCYYAIEKDSLGYFMLSWSCGC